MDPLDELTRTVAVKAGLARQAFLMGHPGESYTQLDKLKDFLNKEHAPQEPPKYESSDNDQT